MAQVSHFGTQATRHIDTGFDYQLMESASYLLENVIKFQGKLDIALKLLQTNPKYVYEDLKLVRTGLVNLTYDLSIKRHEKDGTDRLEFEAVKAFLESSDILKFDENTINILRKHFESKRAAYDFYTTINSFYSEFPDNVDNQHEVIERTLDFTTRLRAYIELQILTMSVAKQNAINIENNINNVVDFINKTY